VLHDFLHALALVLPFALARDSLVLAQVASQPRQCLCTIAAFAAVLHYVDALVLALAGDKISPISPHSPRKAAKWPSMSWMKFSDVLVLMAKVKSKKGGLSILKLLREQ